MLTGPNYYPKDVPGDGIEFDGLKLKNIGNHAFIEGFNGDRGSFYGCSDEETDLNETWVRTADIAAFTDTRELEHGFFGCTVLLRNGQSIEVYEPASFHYQTYYMNIQKPSGQNRDEVPVFESVESDMMRFRPVKGHIDMVIDDASAG